MLVLSITPYLPYHYQFISNPYYIVSAIHSLSLHLRRSSMCRQELMWTMRHQKWVERVMQGSIIWPQLYRKKGTWHHRCRYLHYINQSLCSFINKIVPRTLRSPKIAALWRLNAWSNRLYLKLVIKPLNAKTNLSDQLQHSIESTLSTAHYPQQYPQQNIDWGRNLRSQTFILRRAFTLERSFVLGGTFIFGKILGIIGLARSNFH